MSKENLKNIAQEMEDLVEILQSEESVATDATPYFDDIIRTVHLALAQLKDTETRDQYTNPHAKSALNCYDALLIALRDDDIKKALGLAFDIGRHCGDPLQMHGIDELQRRKNVNNANKIDPYVLNRWMFGKNVKISAHRKRSGGSDAKAIRDLYSAGEFDDYPARRKSIPKVETFIKKFREHCPDTPVP